MRQLVKMRIFGLLFFLSPFLFLPAFAIDYSDPARWLNVSSGDMPVDVIYLYPTAWQPAAAGGMYSAIDEANMIAGANAVYERQATAFESVANVYAPYYRQMNINKTLGAGMTTDELEQVIGQVPARDVMEALDYYFANYNDGRPFILAGHSQGTQVMMVAMTEYFQQHPELQERMVAAYLIGYTVTDEFLGKGNFNFAAGADDTGVVISWNTEAPGVTGNPVVTPGALVINPLNWKTNGTYAGLDENLGSFMLDANGTYALLPGMADAFIDPDRGTLLTNVDPSSVDALPAPFPAGSFHGYDYQFYYANIMANALHRSLVYLNRPQAALYSAAMRTDALASRAFFRAIPSFRDTILADDLAKTSPASAGGDGQALASMACASKTGVEIFASPFGDWMRQKQRDGYAGYDLDGGGIAVGARKSWDNFMIGLAGGYSRQRTKMTGMDGKNDADIFHSTLFAGYRIGDFFLEGMAGYGRSWNDARRSTLFGSLGVFDYSADYARDLWSTGLKAGYAADLPGRIRLVPSVGVDAVWVRSPEFVESGRMAAMQLEKARYTSVETPISILVEKQFAGPGKIIAPWLEAAWIPELGDRRPEATVRFSGNSSAGTFQTAAAAVRSRGKISTGVKADIDRAFVNFGYGFEFGGSYRNHQLNVRIGMSF